MWSDTAKPGVNSDATDTRGKGKVKNAFLEVQRTHAHRIQSTGHSAVKPSPTIVLGAHQQICKNLVICPQGGRVMFAATVSLHVCSLQNYLVFYVLFFNRSKY